VHGWASSRTHVALLRTHAALRQVAGLGTPYVAMHMRGEPATMQAPERTAYADVCADVGAELATAAERAVAAGIEPWRIILDPGAPCSCLYHAAARVGRRASETTHRP
jgi:dihydropteroate synthase